MAGTLMSEFDDAVDTIIRVVDGYADVENGLIAENERLTNENEDIRELVQLMVERDEKAKLCVSCNPLHCNVYGSSLCERIGELTKTLGIEVD